MHLKWFPIGTVLKQKQLLHIKKNKKQPDAVKIKDLELLCTQCMPSGNATTNQCSSKENNEEQLPTNSPTDTSWHVHVLMSFFQGWQLRREPSRFPLIANILALACESSRLKYLLTRMPRQLCFYTASKGMHKKYPLRNKTIFSISTSLTSKFTNIHTFWMKH